MNMCVVGWGGPSAGSKVGCVGECCDWRKWHGQSLEAHDQWLTTSNILPLFLEIMTRKPGPKSWSFSLFLIHNWKLLPFCLSSPVKLSCETPTIRAPPRWQPSTQPSLWVWTPHLAPQWAAQSQPFDQAELGWRPLCSFYLLHNLGQSAQFL